MNILINNWNYYNALTKWKKGDIFVCVQAREELYTFIREAAKRMSEKPVQFKKTAIDCFVPENNNGARQKKYLQVMRLKSKSAQDTKTMNYRRFNLNKYLKRKFPDEVDTLDNLAELWRFTNTIYDTVVVSCPLYATEWLPHIQYKHLVFDRSDDWTAMHPERPDDEKLVISRAEKVTYTALSMKDQYDYKESKYLPNGLNTIPYTEVEKYPRKTAVYIGRNNNKVDWTKIENIAKNNLDWDILIYSGIMDDFVEFKSPNIHFKGYLPEDELQMVLRRCHVGLIPFLKSDVTEAMCPLKVYHYANAHIPVLYCHNPHCEQFPFCIEWHTIKNDLNFVSYDGEYEPYYRDWKDIFRELLEFWEYGNYEPAPDYLDMKDIIYVHKTGDTFKISWKMTDTCNLRCSYCYMYNAVHRNKPTTPFEDILAYASRIDGIIEKQAKGRKVSLHLIGGEPAAFYKLWEVLDKIKSPLLHKIIVATNFTQTEEYWQTLKDYCNKRNIMCQIIASFHLEMVDADKWIEKAIKLGANVKCVMNKDNIEQYKLYLERAKKANLVIEPTIERDDTNSCQVLSKEDKDYIRSLYDYNNRGIYYLVTTKDNRKYGFKSNIQMINATIGFDTEGMMCSAGLSGIRINPNGTVQRAGCRHASIHKIGHILDDDLLDKLPTEPFVCHTHESDDKGLYKEKNCTAFINSDMWRVRDDCR